MYLVTKVTVKGWESGLFVKVNFFAPDPGEQNHCGSRYGSRSGSETLVTIRANNISLDIYRIGMKNEKLCVVAVTGTVTNKNQNPDPHQDDKSNPDPNHSDADRQNWTVTYI
jgi:hypothetical protein